MAAAEGGADSVTLCLPEGAGRLVVSKRALLARTGFFAPLADEPGPAVWAEGDWGRVVTSLSPSTREALPAVLRRLGAEGEEPWGALLQEAGVLQAFAAAHVLGATELVEAARDWAAADASRLVACLEALDARADAAVLRAAARHGLDLRSPTKLLHAAALADAAAAVEVIVGEEDALGDAAAQGGGAGALSPIDLRDGSGRTALQLCAAHNCAAAAAALLDASASLEALCDPPEEDEEELPDAEAAAVERPLGLRTALHLAAASDSAQVVQLLLERRADVACCLRGVPGAVTPLHECAAGDAARAAAVLAPAAARLSRQTDAWTLADAVAAVSGSAPMADGDEEADAGPKWSRFLDPLQAKIGTLGVTPLHAAAEEDAPGVIRALLEAKADVALGDDHGDTPVHYAALYAAPRALAELLSAGANPACENAAGETPLHQVAEFGLDEREAQPEASAALLRRHFLRSFRAQELLLEALRARGQLAAALQRGSDGDGNRPLHSIALRNHLGAAHAAKLFVEAGCDVDVANGDGHTALELAVRRHGEGSLIAKALVQLGARAPRPAAAGDAAKVAGGGAVTGLAESLGALAL